MAEVITRGTDINTSGTDLDKVSLTQAINDWQNSELATNLASIATIVGTPKAGGTAWVSCENGVATIHFDDGSGGSSSGSEQPSSTAYDGNPINLTHDITLNQGTNTLKITLPASINEPIEATLFIHHGESENGTSVTITLDPNNTSSLYTFTDDLNGNNHRVSITFNSDSLTQEQAQAIASSIEAQ